MAVVWILLGASIIFYIVGVTMWLSICVGYIIENRKTKRKAEESMTQKQKDLLKLYKEEIEIREKLIQNLFRACQHEHTTYLKYLDYDRNRHLVSCEDCGRVLFSGNKWEYEAWKEKHS